MKQSAIVLTLALGMSAGCLTAQAQTGAPPAGERPPLPPADAAQRGPQQRPGGLHLLPPGVPEILKLTAEQLKQVADLEAEVQRLIDLGATETARHSVDGGFRWVVLADPDGNAFCVAAPRP